ncbi:MAG: hypothetical protein ACQETH_01995 [Candidatus Rifleibacteriota bacterium]
MEKRLRPIKFRPLSLITESRRLIGSRRAFTFVELLISMGIVVLIAGGVIIAMSRGASNVHRGSFSATASNQAAWIVTIMRRDIARSNVDKIIFQPDSGDKWTGTGRFVVETNDGTRIDYSIKESGDARIFQRLNRANSRKIRLGSGFLNKMEIQQKEDFFAINLLLIDPMGKAVDFKWNARIFPPVPAGVDKFWKPVSEIE